MGLLLRLVGWLAAIAVAVVIVVFAIANRAPVPVSLDPLPFAIEAPLYAAVLGAFVVGLVAGALGVWPRLLRGRAIARRGRRELEALERERVRREEEIAAKALSAP
jgi:uncharacterized integral membrane protein